MSLRMRRRISVVIGAFFLLQPMVALRAQDRRNPHRNVVNQFYIPPAMEPPMSHNDLVALIQPSF